MSDVILTPPVAFLIYLGLAGLLSLVGRRLAPRTGTETKEKSALRASTYAGGEAPPTRAAAPGYRPFFIIALFFAILHLGVLMLGSGAITWVSAAYLVGLLIALIALILG